MDRPTLEIVAGFHSGVARKLNIQHYRIGSASGADIVLRDPGVEPEHAILRIERHGARIEATGGDINLGAEVLAKGHGCRLRYPFELSLGQARIRLTGNAPDQGFFQPIGEFIVNHPRSSGAGVIGAMLLLALIAGRSPRDSGYPGPGPAQIHTAVEAVSVTDAARELNDQLNSAGIHGLKITTAGGRVAVSGIIPSSAASSWTAIQQWFDATYKGRLMLTATVAIGEAKNLTSKLRLQAIWFGEHPYVITDDGVRRYAGGALDDGWMIREIRDKQIILAKEGQTITLTYR